MDVLQETGNCPAMKLAHRSTKWNLTKCVHCCPKCSPHRATQTKNDIFKLAGRRPAMKPYAQISYAEQFIHCVLLGVVCNETIPLFSYAEQIRNYVLPSCDSLYRARKAQQGYQAASWASPRNETVPLFVEAKQIEICVRQSGALLHLPRPAKI